MTLLLTLATAATSLLHSVPTQAPAAGSPARASTDTLHRFVVQGEGNAARYRVREQLAGVSLPNDAVGETTEIAGQIVLDASGRIVPGQSRFTVQVASLKSDRDRRDNYVRTRTLETTTHPTVVLEPLELRGLPWPLPAAGPITFQLRGNLTVRGVTRPTTWEVRLTPEGTAFRGSATTSFTFEEFTMTKPRVASVLSVDDVIKLEYDLRLVKQ